MEVRECSSFEGWLQAVSRCLESHFIRDQLFRTLQFGLALCGGALEAAARGRGGGGHKAIVSHAADGGSLAERLLRVSSRISDMRVMLRLMDDLPMLAHTLQLWKSPSSSSDERSAINRRRKGWLVLALDLVSTLADQLYYPLEHLAWASDQSLLPLPLPFPSRHLWTLGDLLWGTSLLVSLMRSLAAISNVTKRISVAKESGNEESASALVRQRWTEVLGAVKTLCDLALAVHWLPRGAFLWSGRLSALWVGLLGTVSSLIALWRTLPRHFR